MVTLLHLGLLGYILELHEKLPEKLPNLFTQVPAQIALIFFVIGVIFFWGMLLHAVTRFIHDLGKKQNDDEDNAFGKRLMLSNKEDFNQDTHAFRTGDKPPKWFFTLDAAHVQDLALYFWYLRGTYLNLAVGLSLTGLLGCLLLFCALKPLISILWLLTAVFMVVLCFHQGRGL